MVGPVLLVEDDPDSRTIFRTILEHSGFAVLEASDGEMGVRIARSDQPAAILMDVSIPKLDGWEATRLLKSDPETAGIPIIVVTAHALAADREKAVEVGCDGYLAKPIEPNLVVSEVRRVLNGEEAAGPPFEPPSDPSQSPPDSL